MFGTQVEQINSAKNRAFGVLAKTKQKLQETVAKANTYRDENLKEVSRLLDANHELTESIRSMEKSTAEIDKIMGVESGTLNH